MRVAVIPARGGSKRIPRKNIKLFVEKPIIAYSILAAQKSELFDAIIVSTDDPEIAEIAKGFGARVPFFRPKDLSGDLANTVSVITHAVRACLELGMAIEWACCIYPCAPFIQTDDLKNAAKLAREKPAHFVYPVNEYAHPIQRAMKMDSKGEMKFINPQFELTRTQDLEVTYHDAGQFYFGSSAVWLDNKCMHSKAIGMPIPHWRVVDIDTLDDWKRAELLYRLLAEDIEKGVS